MQLGLINSALAQAGRDTKFGIELTKAIGFDTIDIFCDPLELDPSEKQLIAKTSANLNLPIKSICCVAVGLVDFNRSVSRFHVERCQAYLNLCNDFHCDNLLLVLGEYIWQREVIPPAEQWQTGVANVRTLGRYAEELGLEIAIELEPFKLSLINSIDTMIQFLDDVDLPEVVKANCDISHLHLMKIPPSEVCRLAGRIAHVHLSDCDGKVHGDLPPGRGVTPIIDYLAAIRDTGFDRTVSIELEYSPQPEKIVEWVTEAYEKTNDIMQQLGCRSRLSALP
ncbi:sugar phosphate isomerase/epimerase family protein [Bythopirellula polymerisocia]|uniref:Fructoselysine 3-epimerase n=1 Tax=Bythopirellula polymerisocia TaxID=2528003 RepID=A0A5C6CMG9_9BACT|nr:sugar phosphate isomerase/epimerase family protein [Bythopirellula polymerisocia]TWU24767.1 fructoselysine 3-epimerase [Bythopirellula polymerisocia]